MVWWGPGSLVKRRCLTGPEGSSTITAVSSRSGVRADAFVPPGWAQPVPANQRQRGLDGSSQTSDLEDPRPKAQNSYSGPVGPDHCMSAVSGDDPLAHGLPSMRFLFALEPFGASNRGLTADAHRIGRDGR